MTVETNLGVNRQVTLSNGTVVFLAPVQEGAATEEIPLDAAGETTTTPEQPTTGRKWCLLLLVVVVLYLWVKAKRKGKA